MKRHVLSITLLILLAGLAGPAGLAACTPQSQATSQPQAADTQSKLAVVATTTIVGDVVAQVGGEFIDLTILLPVGASPHSFEPSPQDIAAVADAGLVFANGAGLEAFLDTLIESAGSADKVVPVSQDVELRSFTADEKDVDEHEDEGEEHDHAGSDPHTWTDPNNVMLWVESIRSALAQADPSHADGYAANAAAYTARLQDLDTWIREQVAQVPAENRKLVTDHTLLGYFADEYGFTQVGALISGYSDLAQPSAQELAQIEDAIHSLSVKAVFVGNTVNPALSERVAQDTGVQLVFFYTGSLSEPDGDAPTYLDYMRYNVSVIVDALK